MNLKKLLFFLKAQFSRKYTFLVVPNSEKTVRSCAIPFPVVLVIVGIITYNLYIVLGFSFQIAEIYQLKQVNFTRSRLLAQLQNEKQKYKSVLHKRDQVYAGLDILQNKQQLLLKTWKAIADEKKIDYLVSRKSTLPKSSPYIIKEVDKKDYRNTALVELENYLGQIENYLAKESEEQQRLLNDLQAYKWKLDHTPSIWPVVSYITSSFGKRVHPVLKYNRKHVGIDMGAASRTKVAATAAGVVSFAGWRGGYGYAVMIDHQNGFQTLYAHNSKLLVSIGQNISKGQTICLSGNTGITTGPHLHYEVYINGKPVNPVPYLKR